MLYVIYPAEDVFDVYDTHQTRRRRRKNNYFLNFVSDTLAVATKTSISKRSNILPSIRAKRAWEQLTIAVIGDKEIEKVNTQEKPSESSEKESKRIEAPFGGAEKSSKQRCERGSKRAMQNNRNLLEESQNPLKDLTHANLNEPIKQHNANAVKLAFSVSNFTKKLGEAMECHGTKVIKLVDEYRNETAESRGDTSSMRRIWDSLLRQVEADARAHLDYGSLLQQQIAIQASQGYITRKEQSKIIFGQRDAYEKVVALAEHQLQQARANYKHAYGALLASPEPNQDSELKRAYLEAHNLYVLQLRATNAIAERYQFHCLPSLLGEVTEVYEELCGVTCTCIAGISESAGDRVTELVKRYQALAKEVKSVNPQSDLQILARNLSTVAQPRKPPRRLFVPPTPPEQTNSERINSVPALRDELVPTGSNFMNRIENEIKIDADRLAQDIVHLQDAIDTLNRMQRKSAEGNLYTKVAELQEDISNKRYDLRVAQLQLAAIHAKKELFGGGQETTAQPDGTGNRKMSNGSTGSTKHKWLKAFKSLKTTPTTPPPTEKGKQAIYHAVSTVVAMSRKNVEAEAGGHQWREYTYRKITPCDACGQVLRGHARQGFRCRNCKANAHADCISAVQPANCPSLLPKRAAGIPLLRRQKSQAPPPDETPSSEQSDNTSGGGPSTRSFGKPLVLTGIPLSSTVPNITTSAMSYRIASPKRPNTIILPANDYYSGMSPATHRSVSPLRPNNMTTPTSDYYSIVSPSSHRSISPHRLNDNTSPSGHMNLPTPTSHRSVSPHRLNDNISSSSGHRTLPTPTGHRSISPHHFSDSNSSTSGHMNLPTPSHRSISPHRPSDINLSTSGRMNISDVTHRNISSHRPNDATSHRSVSPRRPRSMILPSTDYYNSDHYNSSSHNRSSDMSGHMNVSQSSHRSPSPHRPKSITTPLDYREYHGSSHHSSQRPKSITSPSSGYYNVSPSHHYSTSSQRTPRSSSRTRNPN